MFTQFNCIIRPRASYIMVYPTCSAESLIICLEASDHIAGIVTTQVISDSSMPVHCLLHSFIKCPLRYLMQADITVKIFILFPVSSCISEFRVRFYKKVIIVYIVYTVKCFVFVLTLTLVR